MFTFITNYKLLFRSLSLGQRDSLELRRGAKIWGTGTPHGWLNVSAIMLCSKGYCTTSRKCIHITKIGKRE